MKTTPAIALVLCSAASLFAESASILQSAAYNPATQASGRPWPVDIYVSTGDNHWLGQSLPIDSPKSISDTFQFFSDLGIKRVYWRGLEAATWVETCINRPENPRYNEFWKWLRHLYKDVDPDGLASAEAKKRGIEIWGVATLVDWGSQADVPPFADWPFNCESKLRIDHPEWIPVDRHGILKQGGAIDFSYPDARKALVDLHMKFMKKDGYAGMIFLTYAENHSMRFQDEFGFNEPVVAEFKKRYGLDPRLQDWTRFASREDWIRLRGEFLTSYVRELKAELSKAGQKLGFFVNPHDIRFPQPWNVPETMRTGGSLYLDLETWVREKLVDQFLVYGYCAPALQVKAAEDMLWLTRATESSIGVLTSGPLNERWRPLVDAGAFMVDACAEDAVILQRSSGLGTLPLSDLSGPSELKRQKVLAQIAEGVTPATVADIRPVLESGQNVITKRLALQAIARIKSPEASPLASKFLSDPEHSVRVIAISSLGKIGDPSSLGPILDVVRKQPTHPTFEMAYPAILRLNPFPKEALVPALKDPDANVRMIAARAFGAKPDPAVRDALIAGMGDPSDFVAFASAESLAKLRRDPDAARALIAGTASERPVVSTRSATSLAEIIARNEPEIAPLKPEIAAALEKQFRSYGAGSKRPDADWGYRPVGNALIACGNDGTQFLQSLIDGETEDPELAIKAWKSLYIRKAPNSFSEVTEKENEEAFRRRPRVLKTSRLPLLDTAFDDTSVFRPDVTGMAGDPNKPLGRWGGFTSAAPAVTSEKAASRPYSVKLEGSSSVMGRVTAGVDPRNDYAVEFKVWREGAGMLTVKTKSGQQTLNDEFALKILADGRLQIGEGSPDAIPATIPEGKWVPVEMSVNPAARTLAIKVDGGKASTVQLPEQAGAAPVCAVEFFSSRTGTPGSFYVDDVRLVDIP